MSERGKKFVAALAKVERSRLYPIEEAVKLVRELKFARFDETVGLSINLGIDPKKTEQQVRGTVSLPGGLGKTFKILVFAKGEKAKEAEAAGAQYVGAEDLVAKVEGGWLDFDVVIVTPDMMGAIGKLGKILGRRGLMPNPKKGTVTFDVAAAIKEFSVGKLEVKNDKFGIINIPIGKVSFSEDKLKDNYQAVLDAVVRLKPATAKGNYIEKVTISSTMGPGVRVDFRKNISPG
jgi:large subunit ribosomal protein L1